MNEAFTLLVYGGRKPEQTFRQMTIDEVQALTGGHIWFRANDGSARKAKVNGKVRRWKREPQKFELPCKYGTYEYHTFTNTDLDKLLVLVGGG